ncbi:ComEA family DNA-binding protein [Agromyces soli]
MPEPAIDPFAALDPSVRRAGPRARIAVGAAVVVFIAAVAIAAIVSFVSSGGGAQGVVAAQGVDRDASGADSGAAAGSAGATGPDAGAGRDASEGGATAVVLVHVLGAVVQPGLVELRPGARVVDAIAAAGGLAADADQAGVNLARPVADGEQLVVPRIGETPPAGASGSAGTAGAGDGLVHLNTADAAELDTLPRIGPALAGRIIDWREANGGFTSVDQLLEVAGIGDAVFAGLAELVAL